MKRFRTLEVLSSGVCTTERVTDELTGRVCIRKRTNMSNSVMARQFRREVAVLLDMEGRNVPAVYDCFEADGELVLIEQEVKGVPIDRLPERKRKQAVIKLNRILERLHELGWVYVDLKPEHVLVDDGEVTLIDFNGTVKKGEMCYFATRSICPPESVLTEKSDVYALGMLLKRLKLFPLFRRRCLRADPLKRPELKDLKIRDPLPVMVFGMALLSVFAYGQGSVNARPNSLERADLIRLSVEQSEGVAVRLHILESSKTVPDEQTLKEIRREVESESDAVSYITYALKLKKQGITIIVDDEWETLYPGDYARLAKIWRNMNADADQ